MWRSKERQYAWRGKNVVWVFSFDILLRFFD